MTTTKKCKESQDFGIKKSSFSQESSIEISSAVAFILFWLKPFQISDLKKLSRNKHVGAGVVALVVGIWLAHS